MSIENIKKIEEKVGPALFNMAINKVFESGRNSWTNKDFIDNALFTVHDVWKDLDRPLINEEYMRNVIETAAEIAKFPIADIYGYIAKYGKIGVDRPNFNAMSKDRMYSLLCSLINDDLEDMTTADVYEKLERVGFNYEDIFILGYDEVLLKEEQEDMARDDDDFHDDKPNTGFEPSVQTIQPIEDDYDLEDCYV